MTRKDVHTHIIPEEVEEEGRGSLIKRGKNKESRVMVELVNIKTVKKLSSPQLKKILKGIQ